MIDPPLVLAPMAGLTHSALRTVIAECGGVGLLFTEMLSARSLPHENMEKSPYLVRSSIERPISAQVLVSDPADIAPAFEKLHLAGMDAIDINLGCRAPRVMRRGAGYALSQNHEQLERVFREARKRTALPLTAKIRLGRSPDDPAPAELAEMLQDLGIDMLYVHARLEKESFARPPRWACINDIRRRARIPVIANGGIFSARDAVKCLEKTGADGLMIGRASAVSPWIFREIAAEVFGCRLNGFALNRPLLYRRFVEILEQRFPEERRLGRLKEFTHYFSQNYKFGHYLAWKVQAASSFDEAVERAEAFLKRHDPE